MSGSLLSRTHGYVIALCLAAGLASLGAPALASAEECPNAAFRTGPSSHLPDCRAYELVSPPFKDAAHPALGGLSPEGSSALLTMGGAVAGLEGFPDIVNFNPGAYYSTRRTASGWTTVPDDPPSAEYLPFEYSGFSDFTGKSLDTQTTVWMERGVWQLANRVDFFMRRPDRSIVDVGPGLPPTVPSRTTPNEVAQPADMSAVGTSADASRLFFALSAFFWPFDGTEESGKVHSLYEYLGTGNTTPMLVGVDDGGKQISQCGVVLGGGSPTGSIANGLIEFNHNAVSTDGNTVFFTAYPGNYQNDGCKGSAPPVAELFARIDNGLADARTVSISEPSKEDCSACDTEASVLANAQFKSASEDGSKVFFSTTQPLLGNDRSSNIYEYDSGAPAGERIVRVSGGDSTVSAPAAEDLEKAKSPIPEDGSHVYFLANGVLTRTPNEQGESAEVGAVNLYVFERDASHPTGRTAFIARLSQQDREQWEAHAFEPADVTPGGRFLVFTSNRDLTPDDTSTAQQVFEYDAQTGALVRVSIGQEGFNHNGNVSVKLDVYGFVVNNATIVTPYCEAEYDASAYSSRLSVSADGSYVFFQSIAGLTPQALDQQVIGHAQGGAALPIYANNVYQYHAGRVSLISDGQDVSSFVQFLGTDASGGDVFLSTVDRLVGQDTDSNVDIYDARIGGGFPAPAVPPSCSGDACQGQLSGAPTLLSPGSEFQAGGNPPLAAPAPAAKPAVKPKAKSTKCKKGFVKKKGKCVRAKAKKASRARRATR
jgi:hypothetical protein